MKRTEFGPAGNSLSFYAEGKKSTIQAFAWLKEKGLDTYEYQGGKGIYATDDTLRAIGEEAAKNGITVSLHAPYYISLSSVEEEKRQNSVNYILRSASASDLLGARIFVVHSGSASGTDREDAIRRAEETLYSAAQALEDGGFKACAGLETMGKINQLGTLEEVVRLCKISEKHFRPVVDFGHLNARTLGGIASVDDYKRIFDTISGTLGAETADRLHCHFSKIEYTKMGEKKHLTFEDTVYGPSYEQFMSAIVSLGVHPTVICESDSTMAEDALTMKNLYEKLCGQK